METSENTEIKSKKETKKGLIITIAILLVLAVAAVGIILTYSNPTKRVERKLAQAERYMTELKYEEAIVLYNQVIKIDPKNLKAHEGLFDAYIATGKLESASELLKKEPLLSEGDKGLWNTLKEACTKVGHKWDGDQCASEQECSICGVTEKKTPEHDWDEDPCASERVCKTCGATEAKEPTHSWTIEPCASEKVCSKCGAKEEITPAHDWQPATTESPKKCRVCGLEEGEPFSYEIGYVDGDYNFLIGHGDRIMSVKTPVCNGGEEYIGKDVFIIKCYTSGGRLLTTRKYSVDFPMGRVNSSWYYTYGFFKNQEKAVGVLVTLSEDKEKLKRGEWGVYTEYLTVIDWDGKEIFKSKLNPTIEDEGYAPYETTEPGIIEIRYTATNAPAYYFDANTLELKSAEGLHYEAIEDEEAAPDIPHDAKWTSFHAEPAINGYYVGNDTQWGYLDSEKNEIAMYADATAFDSKGYALVSKDWEHYDVIDSNFNVVATDIVQADGVWYHRNSDSFMFHDGNGYRVITLR